MNEKALRAGCASRGVEVSLNSTARARKSRKRLFILRKCLQMKDKRKKEVRGENHDGRRYQSILSQ